MKYARIGLAFVLLVADAALLAVLAVRLDVPYVIVVQFVSGALTGGVVFKLFPDPSLPLPAYLLVGGVAGLVGHFLAVGFLHMA